MPTVEIVVDLGLLGEQEISVEYDYTKGRPGKMTLKGGDPGYPDDPEEIDITDVSCEDLAALLRRKLDDHEPLFEKIREQENQE